MILGIRTDRPEAELYVFSKDGTVLDEVSWYGHRQLSETIHLKIKELLQNINCELQDVSGVVVYKGPGSFTGLRIGISVANALATGLGVPLIGEQGEQWSQKAVEKLGRGENDEIVLPDYGSPPHITKPRK